MRRDVFGCRMGRFGGGRRKQLKADFFFVRRARRLHTHMSPALRSNAYTRQLGLDPWNSADSTGCDRDISANPLMSAPLRRVQTHNKWRASSE